MDFEMMETSALEARKLELRSAIDVEGADLDAIEAEVRSINAELETRKNVEAEKAEERKMVAEAEVGTVEEVKEFRNEVVKMDIKELRSSKEYMDAYATAIKTGKDTELRSLLTDMVSSGEGVPVPTLVDDVVRHAWESNELTKYVKKTYMKGIVKVGREVSATGAEFHNEGEEAPEEQQLDLAVVEIAPVSIKKWITISDEAMDMTSEAFLSYIYEELTHHIVKKACDKLINEIQADAYTKYVKSAPALGAIAQAMAKLSDEAQNPVIIMNKATWGAFKAAQYAGNFAADIFEGLPVVFSNYLRSYDDATSDEAYVYVGDLGHGAMMNFPNGQEVTIKVDDLSLAEKDLVKFVGRQYVGVGIVGVGDFVGIQK